MEKVFSPFDISTINEFVPAGAKEIWSIRNMSPMAHPFYAHAIQYQILTRIRVIGDFSTAEGDYMYHCHILEHGDTGNLGAQ